MFVCAPRDSRKRPFGGADHRSNVSSHQSHKPMTWCIGMPMWCSRGGPPERQIEVEDVANTTPQSALPLWQRPTVQALLRRHCRVFVRDGRATAVDDDVRAARTARG